MSMREKMARAGYETALRRAAAARKFDPDDAIHSWDNQSEALKADWFAFVDAHLDALLTIQDHDEL